MFLVVKGEYLVSVPVGPKRFPKFSLCGGRKEEKGYNNKYFFNKRAAKYWATTGKKYKKEKSLQKNKIINNRYIMNWKDIYAR